MFCLFKYVSVIFIWRIKFYNNIYILVFSLAIMKKVGALFVLCFTLLIGSVSAAGDQTILKLSSATNAHGALWNDSLYSYSVDYGKIFGANYTGTNPHNCTGTNAVLWLSSATNAHASTENVGGTQTTVTNPSFMYTITHDGDSSSGSVDCTTKTSPGAGYALQKRECLKDNGQICLSDVCLWYKQVTDIVRDYTITRGTSDCEHSTSPGAGYALQKRECLLEQGGSCTSDLCLWQKQVTDNVRNFTITRGNGGGAACDATNLPAGYTKVAKECLQDNGQACISDLCLWQKVLGAATTTTTSGGSYNTQVCYGDLVCTARSSDCVTSSGEKIVARLSANTNSHVSGPNNFPSGAVGIWGLDGDVQDSSGNSNNGANHGISFVGGKVGQAGSFSGSNSYVTVSGSSSLKSSVFTYSAWINPSAVTGNNRTILGNGVYGSPRITIRPDGSLALLKTNVLEIGRSASSISANVWTHIAVTYDGSGNYAFYINGGLSGSGINLVPFDFTNSFFEMGRDSSISSEYFSGKIDEVSVYNRALTQSEVQSIYDPTIYNTNYPIRICCKQGGAASSAYWANMDGVRTEVSWLDGSVKLVSDVVGGTYTVEKYENVLIGDDWTSVATLTAGAEKNYAVWKTASSGIYRFKINGLESGELNVSSERTITNPTIDIVSPACGNDYNLGQTINFVINVSDPKDLVTGNITLGDGSSREIENGLNSFTYNYTTKGTKQIIAQVTDSNDGRSARAVTNIILLNPLEDDLFIAACIESPKNLQKFDGSRVTFDSSTTRALNFSKGIKTEISDDSLTFNWTLSDIGSNRVYCTFKGSDHSCTHSVTGPMMVSRSADIKGYHFTWTFPSSGDNWAGLVVDL